MGLSKSRATAGSSWGGAVALMIWGGVQATRLPRRLPDLNKPTVTLMTEAGGMAPEEVEQLISFPLETAMSGPPGVAGIRSVSSARLSFTILPSIGGRYLPRPADGRRAAHCDGRPCRGQCAAHGAGVVDHGRDHAGRHS